MLSAITSTTALAVIAPSLSILQCLAQVARIRRVGAQGVALATWIVSVFGAEVWFGYGVIFRVPAELATNLPYWILATWVTVAASRSQKRVRAAASGYLLATALAVGATLLGLTHPGRTILATVADVTAIVSYLPQLRATLRSDDLAGVSLLSWVAALITSVAWAAYGILIHQPAVALPTLIMAPSALTIVAMVTRDRRRNPAPIVAVAPATE